MGVGLAMQINRECRMRAAIFSSIAKDVPELEIQLLYVAKEWLTLAIISEQFNAEGHRGAKTGDQAERHVAVSSDPP
jgi:hypothetical protein